MTASSMRGRTGVRALGLLCLASCAAMEPPPAPRRASAPVAIRPQPQAGAPTSLPPGAGAPPDPFASAARSLSVAELGPGSGIVRVGPWLARNRGGRREVWGSRGAWEANDFVAALPSGDVAGVWPDHLFASTFDHFQQVQEWDGKVWRPTPGLPATDLQPLSVVAPTRGASVKSASA